MIISPSRGFIFIHLEKCGGTSIETALQPYLHWSDMILGSTDFGERNQQNYYDRFGRENVNKNMLWKHSTAKDIHAFIGPDSWDDFNKISVVRNPQEIIKSLYFFSKMSVKYHVGRINRQKWKELLRVGNFPDSYPYSEGYVRAYAQTEIDGMSIDRFVELLLSGDYGFVAPQVKRLEINKLISLGHVYDLSKINESWNDILEVVGISEDVRLDRLNSSEREDVQLSDKSKRKIKKHFAIDYDVLPKYTGVHW